MLPDLWLEPKLACVANEPVNLPVRHHPIRLDNKIPVHKCFVGKWLYELRVDNGFRAVVDH
jgi:hypothetical protein